MAFPKVPVVIGIALGPFRWDTFGSGSVLIVVWLVRVSILSSYAAAHCCGNSGVFAVVIAAGNTEKEGDQVCSSSLLLLIWTLVGSSIWLT